MILSVDQKNAIEKALKFANEHDYSKPEAYAHCVNITGIDEESVFDYLYEKEKQEGELF